MPRACTKAGRTSSWYCRLFHGLYDSGIDMKARSTMMLGSSAGAYGGLSLASGRFAGPAIAKFWS
jgi:hypothetical protein